MKKRWAGVLVGVGLVLWGGVRQGMVQVCLQKERRCADKESVCSELYALCATGAKVPVQGSPNRKLLEQPSGMHKVGGLLCPMEG